MRKTDDEGMGRVAAIRDMDSHMSVEERRILELRNLLDGDLGGRIREQLGELGQDADSFFAWVRGDEPLLLFWEAVPFNEVPLTLMLERDRNPDNKTHSNDARDWSFLNLAIPYANVVATEKQWAHLARQAGLAKRYSTVVLGDLRKLPEVLADEGCLP